MSEKEMYQRVGERATELLKIPQVNKVYQSKRTKKEAEEYIFSQALITLLFSHEERIEMAK